MKKLSFLLALVLVFSTLCFTPVFAASKYEYTGDADVDSNLITYKWSNSASSGIASEHDQAGPHKAATDKVYKMSGTSLVDDSNFYNYFVGRKFSATAMADSDFNGLSTYTWEVDVFIPSKASTEKAFVFRVGNSSTGLNCAFIAGDKPSDVTTYNTKNVKVFYGLDVDKWHNIVITLNIDKSASTNNLTYSVYLDGAEFANYWQTSTSSTTLTAKTGSASIKASSTAVNSSTTYTPNMMLTFDMAINDVFEMYYDNYCIYPTVNTPTAAATLSDEGDVVDETNKIVTLGNTNTVADITTLATLTAGATIEVYRADSNEATGYKALTTADVVADGDIVKLTSAGGQYSYYDVNIEVPTTPYAKGNLNVSGFNANPAANTEVSLSLPITGTVAGEDITLVLCLYKGITLIDMITDSIAKNDQIANEADTLSVSLTPSVSGTHAKYFVWHTLTGMTDVEVTIAE